MKAMLPGTVFDVEIEAGHISGLNAIDSLGAASQRLTDVSVLISHLAEKAESLEQYEDGVNKLGWDRVLFAKECALLLPFLADRLDVISLIIKLVEKSLDKDSA